MLRHYEAFTRPVYRKMIGWWIRKGIYMLLALLLLSVLDSYFASSIDFFEVNIFLGNAIHLYVLYVWCLAASVSLSYWNEELQGAPAKLAFAPRYLIMLLQGIPLIALFMVINMLLLALRPIYLASVPQQWIFNYEILTPATSWILPASWFCAVMVTGSDSRYGWIWFRAYLAGYVILTLINIGALLWIDDVLERIHEPGGLLSFLPTDALWIFSFGLFMFLLYAWINGRRELGDSLHKVIAFMLPVAFVMGALGYATSFSALTFVGRSIDQVLWAFDELPGTLARISQWLITSFWYDESILWYLGLLLARVSDVAMALLIPVMIYWLIRWIEFMTEPRKPVSTISP